MSNASAVTHSRGVWSDDEHERYVEGLQLFPNGPWKAIAERVGTRTVRQVQTHARKYQERAARRLRDLRQDRERMLQPTHLIEQEMREICETLQQYRVPLSPQSTASQQRSIDRLTEASWTHFGDQANNVCDGQADSHTIPTFDECIDFLIDAFDSTGYGSE